VERLAEVEQEGDAIRHRIVVSERRARAARSSDRNRRRPPRGVSKNRFAKDDWYDVWFPILAPSAQAVQSALSSTTPAQWARFTKRYRSEMGQPEAKHALELLAALSWSANVSVGCYCEDESRCHRSILRQLLVENGARVEKGASAKTARGARRSSAHRRAH
jgi:uncharacterized protein YeaO (DUF488 family)